MIKLLTLIGFVVGLAVMGISIKQISSNATIYYSLSSFGIIMGGLVVSIFISYRATGALYFIGTVWEVLSRNLALPKFIALRFTDYSKIVAKGGFVALEKEIEKIDEKSSPIEKRALEMLVAGYNKDDIRYIIENYTIERLERLKDNSRLLRNLAAYSPGFGMIGTVIGLIAMLHNMGDDIASIGPAMSVALITTLYGVAFSMLIFTPLAEKTQRQLNLLMINYRIILDGITYLHEKKNYVFMRDALNAHLLPKYQLTSDEKK